MNPAGKTILLVEDNPDDVFAMERAVKLGRIANPLQVVTDGQQALDYLWGKGAFSDRTAHPLPFIVFLDLKLPYVHGFDVLAKMRLEPAFNDIVVVVLTSSAEERDYKRAYALGARSYLVKPPTVEALTSLFNSLDSYWLSRSSVTPLTFGEL